MASTPDRSGGRSGRLTASPVVLVAHGSRDPRAAAATRALARAVEAADPAVAVHPAYLDHTTPRPADVLHALAAAGHPGATLVPLLLTAAYHGRVDVPAAVADAYAAGLRIPVRVTEVLGPAGGIVDRWLLAGLVRRLAAAGTGFDAVVLAAAGTRDAAARATVDLAAAALGTALGVPCVAAYASAAPPAVGTAVARLRARGAHRVGMAAYFLAPGRLYAEAAAAARSAGAVGVAGPLEGAPEIARLVLARVELAGRSPIPLLAA
ncbi:MULTISPECIES: CbiX/SirB N-terminal domain-containing protein [Polymorphospora]|uniref:CbiX/SirB N-terminal domain-containing protein n=1 Tax=Polymorphospora lycopeni TaxID=3140240 RepID=A0ABV5CYB4_9ACTN